METQRKIFVYLSVFSLLLSFGTLSSAQNAFSPYSHQIPLSNNGLKKPSCTSRECHFKQFEKIEYSFRRHPGASKTEEDHSCIFCHAEDNLLRSDTGNDKNARVYDSSLRTLHRVGLSNLTPSTKYQFRIRSTDSQGKTVLMESNDFVFSTASISASEKKELSSGVIQPVKQNFQDSIPPQITDISIEDIKWGPLLSAKVTWKTDKPSTSKVEYGTTFSFGFITPADFSLVMDHAINIHGLRPGTTYYYRVESTAPSGCCTASETKSFTTPSSKMSLIFQKKFPIYDWIIPSVIAQSISTPLLITNISISRITDRSGVIIWETNRPSDTLLEYQALSSKEQTNNFLHPPMKKKERSGLEACYGCHPVEKLGKSHPVKVNIRKELRKPSDLPLGEKEVILCTTCHDPHGCNQRFLVRKDRKRELCISCHNPEKIEFRQIRGR